MKTVHEIPAVLGAGDNVVNLRETTLYQKFCGGSGGGFSKGGWHPQPIKDSALELVKPLGLKQKLVFFARFWKVLVKEPPDRRRLKSTVLGAGEAPAGSITKIQDRNNMR